MKYSETHLRVKNKLELVGLNMHSYGLDQQSPISFWEFEIDALIDAALRVPDGNFVEYGSFYGGSSCLLGLTLQEKGNNKLDSIDIKHGLPFYRNVYRRARLDNIVVYDMKSCDYKHDGSPISLTLSDSWHDFKTVLAEFKNVEPYTIPGGVFAVHDCEPDTYDNIFFYQERYKANLTKLLGGEHKAVDSARKDCYHSAEAEQDFEHGAAIAYILDNYTNWELVRFGPTQYQSMESITGPWQRGRVSPVSSLVFLEKK